MGNIEHSNEHMAAWAMQELSRPGVTFSERVEARKVIGEIVTQADAYRGAVEALAELLRIKEGPHDDDRLGDATRAWAEARAVVNRSRGQ